VPELEGSCSLPARDSDVIVENSVSSSVGKSTGRAKKKLLISQRRGNQIEGGRSPIFASDVGLGKRKGGMRFMKKKIRDLFSSSRNEFYRWTGEIGHSALEDAGRPENRGAGSGRRSLALLREARKYSRVIHLSFASLTRGLEKEGSPLSQKTASSFLDGPGDLGKRRTF